MYNLLKIEFFKENCKGMLPKLLNLIKNNNK